MWIALLLGAWGGAALAAYGVSRVTGREVIVCPLRRWTGVPCPTCGGTRAAVALAMLEPGRALALNPLVTVGLVVLPLWGLMRWGRGVPEWLLSRRAMWVMLGLLAMNWGYVLWREFG